MKAVQLALIVFLPEIMGQSLVLMSKNAVGVAYLRKQGNMISWNLCSLAQEVIEWSELHIVLITARYIPKKNIIFAYQLICPDQVLTTLITFS